MDFLENIKNKAKQNKKTIVLPESLERRTLEATHIILKESIADVILVGNKEEILKVGQGLNLDNAIFIDNMNYNDMPNMVEILYDMRKNKGLTKEQAEKLLQDPLYFGVMLVKVGKADGMVAGAINSTANVIRPALQILKTAPNTKAVSSFFIMNVPNCSYGQNGIFLFSDSGLIPNPTSEELVCIAESSAKSFSQLIEEEPVIAMLSFSTKGSANHPSVDKVVEAVKMAKETLPNLKIDGEFQLDAAIDKTVANQKAPGNEVAGNANVLIFPNLDAGNIGYKLVQRLAKAEAYGPITQGVAKPVNDLSRGCSAMDIVGVVAITSVQAQING